MGPDAKEAPEGAAGLAVVAPVSAQDVVAPDHLAEAVMVAESIVADGWTPGLSVAVSVEGEVVWAQGFGLANVVESRVATADSIYDVGWAITELCTHRAVAALAARGHIDLEEASNEYLPGARLRALRGEPRSITIRRLLERRAGLPRYWSYVYGDHESLAMEETIERHGFSAWGFAKADQWRRDRTLGGCLLAYVVQTVGRKPWADVLAEEVFAPLEMDHTAVHLRPPSGDAVTTRYDRLLGGGFEPTPDYRGGALGIVGVWSSAVDVLRLLPETEAPEERGAARGTIPASAALREAAAAIWRMIPTESDGNRRVTGSVPGASGMLAYYPDEDVGLAVLANVGDSRPVQRLLSAIEAAVVERRWGTAVGLGGGSGERLDGTWRGTLKWPSGAVAVRLEVPDDPEWGALLHLGDRDHSLGVEDVGSSWLRADVSPDGRLVFPGHHGAVRLRFDLRVQDEQELVGVVSAEAAGAFSLPFELVLRKD